MTHWLNKQLLFSSGLPEIAGLMLIYECGLETRTQTSPLDTVRIKNHKTQQEQLKRVTSIGVKHKTSHKLPAGTSRLSLSLVRVLNVWLVGVSCCIIVRWCNYWHSTAVALKCYLASDWNSHWDHLRDNILIACRANTDGFLTFKASCQHWFTKLIPAYYIRCIIITINTAFYHLGSRKLHYCPLNSCGENSFCWYILASTHNRSSVWLMNTKY